ncbi:hypothetical protein F0562_025187 [Nyssa sinensis]|uniref:Uncharacterized protein n=1 Tax=Nyssa sinensis TaxID=561372 RepID=A0A5J5BEY4_9ASTE|nr:hypothetical protein F0562_025187 [Nyssa sinensis]
MQSNYFLCFLDPSSGELGLESFARADDSRTLELGAVELLLLPAEPRLRPMIPSAAGEGFELMDSGLDLEAWSCPMTAGGSVWVELRLLANIGWPPLPTILLRQSKAKQRMMAEILGKEDLRSGDVVVLEKRWRWGRHLTTCRVSYATEVVVDGGIMGFGFLATVGCYESCDVAVLSVATVTT